MKNMMKYLIGIMCLVALSPSLFVFASQGSNHTSEESLGTYVIAVIVAALVISAVYISGLVKSMNTVRPAPEASNYIVKDSFVLSEQSDRFLYSHTSRVRIQKNSSGPRK